jgi:hypothetical protein
MKIELNTDLVDIFSGTYYTVWTDSLDNLTEEDENGNELDGYCDYSHDDLMKSIVEAYAKHETEIVQSLNVDFLKRVKFTDSTSPQFYNFTTDRLNFTATINKRLLMKKLDELKNDISFNDFLHERYSSRDGFWSFTPNNYKELRETIENSGDHFEQAIGAVITYLAQDVLSDSDEYYDRIESTIHEYWQGNGYCGLDYRFVEEDVENV